MFKFSDLTISAMFSSCQTKTKCFSLLLKSAESVCEVKALMEKMKQLQECREEEEASQEEMATRFEREKRESMFVCSSGRTDAACMCLDFSKSPSYHCKRGKGVTRCLRNVTVSLEGSRSEVPRFLPGILKSHVVPRFVASLKSTMTLSDQYYV